MYYGRRFDYLFMAVLPISRRTGSRWIWSSLCVYPVESPSINIRFNSLVRLSTESLLRSSDRWNWLCRLDPQPVGTHQADSPHAPFVQFCEHLTPDQGAPHVFVGAPPRHFTALVFTDPALRKRLRSPHSTCGGSSCIRNLWRRTCNTSSEIEWVITRRPRRGCYEAVGCLSCSSARHRDPGYLAELLLRETFRIEHSG